MRISSRVYVYTYVDGCPVVAGQFVHEDGLGSFEYLPEYLRNPYAYPLDPANLPLREGVFTTREDGGFFGVMLDSQAQEWGRFMMNYLDLKILRKQGSASAETLLGDDPGMDPHELLQFGSGYGTGSLRYSDNPGLDENSLEPSLDELDFNKVHRLRRLMVVLGAVEDGARIPSRCQRMLIPGMSLGGARPKALVTIDNALWIAKFSRKRESINSPLVEFCTNELAREAGIDLAGYRCETVQTHGRPRSAFLSLRFDRSPDRSPRHYLSAASILGAPQTRRNAAVAGSRISHGGYSYMDIARALRRFSSAPAADCRELYRRMVFNVLMGVRDDHLCNHGFIKDLQGHRYRLAPCFDIALDPDYAILRLHQIGLGAAGATPAIYNVLSRCGEFGLEKTEAAATVKEVAGVVGSWQDVFRKHGVREEDMAWVDRLVMKGVDKKLREALKGRPEAEMQEIPAPRGLG